MTGGKDVERRGGASELSRSVPIDRERAAVLLIDLQNYSLDPQGGAYRELSETERDCRYDYFFRRLKSTTLPNVRRLLEAGRGAGVEVIHTVMESLTLDGRDAGLDYKISGLALPKGSSDAHIPEALGPVGDEIVIPKTSSSVFISTNLDYVLRNLDVHYLVVAGVLTDQCVDSAVRDACDLGYRVTLVTDACATHSPERETSSLANNAGYCRQVTTDEIIGELADL